MDEVEDRVSSGPSEVFGNRQHSYARRDDEKFVLVLSYIGFAALFDCLVSDLISAVDGSHLDLLHGPKLVSFSPLVLHLNMPDVESSSSMPYPSCWSDDARMTALFAPFRDRSLNPQDWESKLAFWSEMVEKWCRSNQCCSFTIDDLNKAFMRNGRVPMCLSTVVNELHRNGTVLTREEFVRMVASSNTWLGWAFDMAVKKPVSWTFRKMKNAVVPQNMSSNTQYFHLTVIKAISDSLLSAAGTDLRGELVDMKSLLSQCGISSIPAKEAYLLACWLEYQGHAAVLNHGFEENLEPHFLIKLQELGKSGKTEISDVDRAVFSLKSNLRALTHHIERLEKERQDVLSEAKSYLAKGMRSLAKSSLRKKKEIERIMEKRVNALENVHILLARIQESSSDSKVLESYQLGAAALKSAFKEAGLSEDMVSKTMDEVQDAVDIHNEIQAALSEPVDQSTDENLEEELAMLLSDRNTPHSGAGGNLPDSPTGLTSSLHGLDIGKGKASSKEGQKVSLLPSTPKTATLSDLPDVPSHPPGSDITNLTSL